MLFGQIIGLCFKNHNTYGMSKPQNFLMLRTMVGVVTNDNLFHVYPSSSLTWRPSIDGM